MAKSNIEWTGETWNPVTGWTKISAGCKFCYAEILHKRLEAMGQEKYQGGFGLVRCHEELLEIPKRWKKSKLVFVNSMSDLFHKDVPDTFILKVFKVMNETPQHTYQVLTKRSERLVSLSNQIKWTDNIWMGVSVEDSKVQYRINDLRQSGAKVKFLSVEPMIGPMDNPNLSEINWIIVGGESGFKPRELKIEWVRDILEKCQDNDIPFFFKQWGSKKFNPNADDPTMVKGNGEYGKGGCMVDGKVIRELPKGWKL